MQDHPITTITSHCYEKFKAHTKFYGLFHTLFISFLAMQVLSFCLFFSLLSKSLFAAIALALFFFTLFSYFVLLFFFQTKKPQQLLTLRQEFLDRCLPYLPPKEDPHSHQIPLAKAIDYFASLLSLEEKAFHTSKTSFTALAPLLEKFSIWLYWKSFHDMKELLLLSSIEELLTFIKRFPTDSSAHAALAHTYSKLCKLYIHPQKIHKDFCALWVSPEYSTPSMKQKFKVCSERAIQELKIVQEELPNEPWIYSELAQLYHLQEKPQEEILQYEALLQLAPEETDLLFPLGMLYFEQGMQTKGLKIYQALKEKDPKKAEELIEYYDSYPLYELALLSKLAN